MKSTIIIPNFNGYSYLAPCLDSLLKGTVQGRILVIDNGSSDRSREVLKAYAERGVETIYLEENTGFCGAVNRGIQESETEYVVLLNNDVTAEPEFLAALEKTMDEHPGAFSAGSQMRMMRDPDYMDNAGDYYCALGWAYDYGKGHPVAEKYQTPRKVFAACGGAAIYRRCVFDEIGLFDELHFAYLEDVDIGWRARIYGYDNLYEPASLVYHAGSSVSGSKYNEFKSNLSSRNSIYIIWKNMPLLQLILNLPFLIAGFGIKILFFFGKGLGKVYLKGLWKGFLLYFREGGRKKHVAFSPGHMTNYLKIQLELWGNIVRRFC